MFMRIREEGVKQNRKICYENMHVQQKNSTCQSAILAAFPPVRRRGQRALRLLRKVWEVNVSPQARAGRLHQLSHRLDHQQHLCVSYSCQHSIFQLEVFAIIVSTQMETLSSHGQGAKLCMVQLNVQIWYATVFPPAYSYIPCVL